MLEDALKEEKESLEEMVTKLQPIVDEFTKIELRLQHINALLGIEPAENANGKRSRINWAKLCRENGLPIKGDWSPGLKTPKTSDSRSYPTRM